MDNPLKDKIARIPDFPKKGILFYDLTPIFADGLLFADLVLQMQKLAEEKDFQFDKIVAIEARGFVLGAALALSFEVGLVLVRKKGKLPRATHTADSSSEYNSNYLEIHQEDIKPDERVLIVDDILATGGTAMAAGRLVEHCGGVVAGHLFVARLPKVHGEHYDKEKIACLMELP